MRRVMSALASALSLALAGCATTSLENVWTSPEAPEKLAFSNLVVACLFTDDVARRSSEDSLVRRIGEDRATPSYSVISLKDSGNTEKVREVIEREGFDGAVVMRLLDVSQQRNWVPGAPRRPVYGGSFYSYHRYSYRDPYPSGRYVIDTLVRVETMIYSLGDEQELIWAAHSETVNPASLTTTVNEIAAEVGKTLRAQGLVE
jgi:hypothetical protein